MLYIDRGSAVIHMVTLCTSGKHHLRSAVLSGGNGCLQAAPVDFTWVPSQCGAVMVRPLARLTAFQPVWRRVVPWWASVRAT